MRDPAIHGAAGSKHRRAICFRFVASTANAGFLLVGFWLTLAAAACNPADQESAASVNQQQTKGGPPLCDNTYDAFVPGGLPTLVAAAPFRQNETLKGIYRDVFGAEPPGQGDVLVDPLPLRLLDDLATTGRYQQVIVTDPGPRVQYHYQSDDTNAAKYREMLATFQERVQQQHNVSIQFIVDTTAQNYLETETNRKSKKDVFIFSPDLRWMTGVTNNIVITTAKLTDAEARVANSPLVKDIEVVAKGNKETVVYLATDKTPKAVDMEALTKRLKQAGLAAVDVLPLANDTDAFFPSILVRGKSPPLQVSSFYLHYIYNGTTLGTERPTVSIFCIASLKNPSCAVHTSSTLKGFGASSAQRRRLLLSEGGPIRKTHRFAEEACQVRRSFLPTSRFGCDGGRFRQSPINFLVASLSDAVGAAAVESFDQRGATSLSLPSLDRTRNAILACPALKTLPHLRRLMRRLFPGTALLLGAFTGARSAHADTLDPSLERLTRDRGCAPGGQFAGYDPSGAVIRCLPDNPAFARLVSQYGLVIAPTAMHSARTTGYGGFQLSVEGSYTSISNDQPYWQRGTQGPQDANGRFSKGNVPPSLLQVYALNLRKGFPFGLELGGNVGYLAQASFLLLGFDARLSLLEGFRKDLPAIVPEVALGGGVRTAAGAQQMGLTVASFDAQLSKQISVGDGSILTPYLGFQYLWIFGDSGLIDATPNTDAVGACRYTGPNVPGNPDSAKTSFDGQPVCPKGSNADFNNTFIFNSVRISRQRIILGLTYRYNILFGGLQVMTDLLSPEKQGGRDNGFLIGESRQVTGAVTVGVIF